MKITRLETPDGVFYEYVEECTLRDAPKIIATMEEIAEIRHEGKPHTLEQAKEMVEYVHEEELTPDAIPDMSLVQFSDDKSSAKMKSFVDKETWAALNETMKQRGFKWVKDGKNSRWTT